MLQPHLILTFSNEYAYEANGVIIYIDGDNTVAIQYLFL